MTELTPFASQNVKPAFWRDVGFTPFIGSKRELGWSPFTSFKREVDRLFDDVFRTPAYGYGDYGYVANWPVVDLKETEHEVLVTAEVPGMTEKDVELYFDKGMLTIRGFKKGEKDELGYSERFYGKFERVIPMPYSVDDKKIGAEFRDGLLMIHFPKIPEAENMKKIPISGTTHH